MGRVAVEKTLYYRDVPPWAAYPTGSGALAVDFPPAAGVLRHGDQGGRWFSTLFQELARDSLRAAGQGGIQGAVHSKLLKYSTGYLSTHT
jgi:hypothetical protein